MNGTPMRRTERSVQLAVMTAPSASVADAVVEARRGHDGARPWIARPESNARTNHLAPAA
jgi:hypothetical protein